MMDQEKIEYLRQKALELIGIGTDLLAVAERNTPPEESAERKVHNALSMVAMQPDMNLVMDTPTKRPYGRKHSIHHGFEAEPFLVLTHDDLMKWISLGGPGALYQHIEDALIKHIEDNHPELRA